MYTTTMITPTQQTTISFNVNVKLKKKLQDIADNYGLTISDLMRISATQLTSRGINIEPALEPNENLARISQTAENVYKSGQTNTVDSVAELDTYFAKVRG